MSLYFTNSFVSVFFNFCFTLFCFLSFPAKAVENLDLQNKLETSENNKMKIQSPNSVKQDHVETQGVILISR